MTAKEYATTLKGKSMYKEYELTDREYFVLIVIDALRICTAEVVAWLAGYADTATTTRVYSHMIQSAQAAAADKIQDILSGYNHH